MNYQLILNNTEQFVKKALDGEGTGHDWWHIERVRNNARLINENEQADMFIIELAVLLHDAGDHKVIKQEEDDYSIARNFLKTQKIERRIIEKVMSIIQKMSFSNTLNTKKEDMSREFYVVQDADRLDAIGAIGIARAFAFGGSRASPLYDPSKSAQKVTSKAEYQAMKSSTLHHFDEKLLLIKDLMNTPTAQKIALERHRYMEDYIEQFLAEWKGER